MGQNNSNFELASEARRAAERCESLSMQTTQVDASFREIDRVA